MLSNWLWGTTQVDEAVDKATSELLPTGAEDIALNLEISDQIRSKSVQPKDAMRALKRRLNHKNPNVQLLALGLTDTCIKNGGDHFLTEVSSREFMDNLVSILKIPVLNLDVKNKILRLVQNWAIAFEGKPTLSYVGQVYKTLKSEGFSFPPQDFAAASSAMVDTQTAPEWIDSDVCLRCRTPFSFTNRKHHCRNCGQVFDQACSSKGLPLPHFGIAQEVRVCDGCYTKLTKSKKEKPDDKKQRRFSSPNQYRSPRELADEELQRAIQLSLEEVGAASVNGRSRRPGYTPSQPEPSTYSKWQTSEPPLVDRSTRPAGEDEENDPDLRAAIEASLREANAPKASAPVTVETPRAEAPGFSYSQPIAAHSYPTVSNPAVPALPNYDLQPLETDVILTFSQTVQEVEAQGGRDLSRYPAVTELYDKANGLRPKLALSLDDTDRKENMLEEMHDKLSQAVRLYDKLLTEQLSRPSWRTAPQQAAASRYNTVDGAYNTWNGAQAGPVTASPPAVNQPQRTWSYGPAQASYTPQYQQQPVPQPPQTQYVQSPVTEPPYQRQQLTQNSAPVPAPFGLVQQQSYSNDPQSSTSQYAPPQAPPQQQYASPTPAPNQLPPQVQPQTFTQYAPTPPLTSLPQSPPPQADQPAQLVTNQYASFAPPQQAQSPPPIEAKNYYAPYQPVVSSPPPISAPPQQQADVSSASHPPTQAAPAPQAGNSYGQQQYQPQHAPPMQTLLPQFPVAPTSNPQSFSMYGPSPGLEKTERKEALLIEL